MYVDRKGEPLESMWLATTKQKAIVAHERWQQLVAVLFYLAWARIPYISFDRAAAEDFYFEAFALPEGAPDDSKSHCSMVKVWDDHVVRP